MFPETPATTGPVTRMTADAPTTPPFVPHRVCRTERADGTALLTAAQMQALDRIAIDEVTFPPPRFFRRADVNDDALHDFCDVLFFLNTFDEGC